MGLDITISTKKHTLDFRKRNWLMGWVKKTLDIPEIENCETYLLSRDQIDDLMDDIGKVWTTTARLKKSCHVVKASSSVPRSMMTTTSLT